MPGLGAFALAGAVGGAGQALLDRAKKQREDALRELERQRELEDYERRRSDSLSDYQMKRGDMLEDEEREIGRENKTRAATRDNLNTIYNSGDPFFSLLSEKEGVGDPATLYGHSQREGGPFAGVDVSNMTIAEAIEFSKPNGEYGQWVARNNNGVVATPMGKAQIVGTTLRRAAEEMGLPMDAKFDENTQREIALYLADQRLAGARSQAEKRSALRSEWVGFKNASDERVDAAISWIQNRDRRSAAIDLAANSDLPASVVNGALERVGLDPTAGGKPVQLDNGQINQIQDFYKDDVESGSFGLRQPTQAEMVSEVERIMREDKRVSLAEAYSIARNSWQTEDVTTETEVPRAALSPLRLFGNDTRTETSVRTEGGFGSGASTDGRAVPQSAPRMPSDPPAPDAASQEEILSDARDAIARGAPRADVIRRLQEYGIDAGLL